MLNEKNRFQKIILDLFYLLVIIALCYICFRLFSWMIVNRNDSYKADIRTYINIALEDPDRNNRLPLVLFRFLYGISESFFYIALYLAVEIGLLVLANNFFLRDYSKADFGDIRYRALIEFFSIAMLFAGPIYIPKIHPMFYKGTFPIFAWHSPTQQMLTFFGVIGTIFFFRMLENYEDGIKWRDWIPAAIFFLLSGYSKPSYILDIVPAVVVLFVIELFMKNRLDLKTKFLRLVAMGMSLVPSGIYLLILHYIIYTRPNRRGNSDIVVSASRFNGFVPLIIAICCSVSLPLIVLLFNHRKVFKDRRYALTILIAIMGLAQWGLFSETGWRSDHGNFTWGSTIGGYMFYLTSMSIILENLKDKNFLAGKKGLRTLYFIAVAASLALSLLSQLYYFYGIYMGRGFWR